MAPIAIDVDPAGGVWGIETRHRRLFRVSPEGQGLTFAAEASGERLAALASQLFARYGLHVFTLDAWNLWVDRYDLQGNWEERFDLAAAAEAGGEALGSVADFCLRRSGELVVLDAERGRLLAFGSHGELRRVLGDAETAGLHRPVALEIDGRGCLYLLEVDPPAILELDLADRFVRRPLSFQLGDGSEATPGLAVDVWGNAFVADRARGAVWVVPADGGVAWALPRDDAPLDPTALAVDEAGRLLIADATRAGVWLFALTYRAAVPGGKGAPQPR